MDTGLILALEVGKFKSVVCVYADTGGSLALDTVPFTQEALQELPLSLGEGGVGRKHAQDPEGRDA